MQLFDQIDPRFGGHGFGGGGFGHHGLWLFGVVPLILWVILIGVAIWAVLRVTSGRTMVSAPTPTPIAPRPDTALEEVRLRYARGEMSREEFIQRTRDLGGSPAEPVDPTQSDAS
jgi:putative membrane protein